MASKQILTFFEHLEELRGRLMIIAIVLALATLAAFTFADKILAVVISPVGKVIFTSPTEGFNVNLIVAFCLGAIMAMPVVLYQVWQFVCVALKKDERRYVLVFIVPVFLFFILGCAFGYDVMLPMMMKFFLSFSTPYLIPMIRASEYVSFVATLVLACGVIFEFPLVIVVLTKMGIATPAFLIEKRRHALVGIFVVSAIITPSTDCVSQIIMAVPLIVLYEISIILSKVTFRLRSKKENDLRDLS